MEQAVGWWDGRKRVSFACGMEKNGDLGKRVFESERRVAPKVGGGHSFSLGDSLRYLSLSSSLDNNRADGIVHTRVGIFDLQ